MNPQILTVSSKGQISIPVAFRRTLSIAPGDKLIAYASGDMLMLKTVKLPSADEFEEAMDEAAAWAAAAGYRESDVNDIIKSVRAGKKHENRD